MRAARRALARRRVIALAAGVAVPATLLVGFGHRGVHAVRNLVVPGSGLFETAWVLGAAFVVATVVATVLWARWGADWLVVAVLAASVGVTLAVSPGGHAAVEAVREVTASRSAHEFPLVILVMAAWQWLRRLPLVNRLRRRPRTSLAGLADLDRLPPADRCRAVTVLALAGAATPENAAVLRHPDLAARARRIALVARGRRGPHALDRDHAAWRTALAATGSLAGVDSLRADARRQLLGVPASEPGWVRLLDGTLAALVLERAGVTEPMAAWRAAWDGELALRRGHRPGSYWTPLGTSLGHAEGWEHALAGAMMPGSPDWPALRARVLGAAARGPQRPHDERLIAAGRLWLTVVDDPEAARILSRPTVRRDPLACAIDLLATSRQPGRTDLRGVPT